MRKFLYKATSQIIETDDKDKIAKLLKDNKFKEITDENVLAKESIENRIVKLEKAVTKLKKELKKQPSE